jgi:hypothetical protein
MGLNLNDCNFVGPAIPEPFAKFELEALLKKKTLLPEVKGEAGKELREFWDFYRRKLRNLGERGGAVRVLHHVLEPLMKPLGFAQLLPQEQVTTREGDENGGWLFESADGKSRLRAWTVEAGIDLDAPSQRGHAYRFSPSRVAQRVLLAKNERLGVLTDGEELRLLFCDPARPDSHVGIRLDRSGGWRGAQSVPDSFRLLLALASPKALACVADLTEQARLTQTRVTAKLREQAKRAVLDFMQELLDHPKNSATLATYSDKAALARALWHEGLVVIYRLLFVLKLEASSDPARAFSFASTSLWRNTYSPNTALARHAREVLDNGADTGSLLEQGLRTLFRMFSEGVSSSELKVNPLGGMLFGDNATKLVDGLAWGERAVAKLLDRLLWTPATGKLERQRVHYGPLDVEDLGRVYEALLELEPGIAAEPMCRLRRQKLEVVVPVKQGEPYRGTSNLDDDMNDAELDADEESADDIPSRAKKTKVEWVEEIAPGSFYLRVGLGRKATGSFYTPHAFVRFLVQETLGPQVAERSPISDPRPVAILRLKVLDPAMGSGHFLVEACRFLGDKLYEACRACDELGLFDRVAELPDPNDELVAYLPSRTAEGEISGLAQRKALASARRLVAVHCLYGVDKNPLAVELAKLSLWLESYAEGLPLTFLDHRLVCGDSLTGPFFDRLLTYPRSGKEIEGLFAQRLAGRLSETLSAALADVRELDKTIGKDVAEVEAKSAAKTRLDAELSPFVTLARTWSGGVMLGEQADDSAYENLIKAVAAQEPTEPLFARTPRLREMCATGANSVAYDLSFPEVFYPDTRLVARAGFDVVLGNPPWDAIKLNTKEFFAAFDFRIVDAPTKKERESTESRLLTDPEVSRLFTSYINEFEETKRVNDRLFDFQKVSVEGDLAGRQLDAFRVFMERNAQLLGRGGATGVVVPSAFHANEGATGVRRLYLETLALQCCYSFENLKKLFEIDSRFKFAAVVARRTGTPTTSFACAFYLHDLEWLFQEGGDLKYTLEFVQRTGGEYLALLEMKTKRDAAVAEQMYLRSEGLAFWRARSRIWLQKQPTALDMTKDSHRFTPTRDILQNSSDPRDAATAAGLLRQHYLLLHEGKTFHQYDDRWGERPRYLVALRELTEKPYWTDAARHYRLAFRAIASSTNERTAIFALLPPGVVFGNSAACERTPDSRRITDALLLASVANTYGFDWALRQRSASNVNLFIIDGCPIPKLETQPEALRRLLAHNALRLSCNHAGYAPLWQEQLGGEWREFAKKKQTWPVLQGDDSRWTVRAATDAVVANAYGLPRDYYEHVLASFSHRSYPKARELCLAAFDELKKLGIDAFCKKHDPYWDIPLVTRFPEPVIELKVPAKAAGKVPAKVSGRGMGRKQAADTRQLTLLGGGRK